jgi:hypothetical protein
MRPATTLAAIVLTALLSVGLDRALVQSRLERAVKETAKEMKERSEKLEDQITAIKRGLADVEARLRERVELLDKN